MVTPVTTASAKNQPAALLDEALRALEPAFRFDNLVARSPERALRRCPRCCGCK
jgi:ABC-type thiamine transport system ATPase subunit